MKSLFASKKGIVGNIIAGVIFLFVFGFTLIFAYQFLTDYSSELINSVSDDGAIEDVAESFLFGFRLFDYLIVLVMVALIIGIGVTSFKIASAPVFFIIMIIFSAFLGYIAYLFNFVFSQFVSQSVFTATTAYFPRTILICTNLHWVALAMMIVGSITMYGKEDKGQFIP